MEPGNTYDHICIPKLIDANIVRCSQPLSQPHQKRRIDLLDCEPYDEGRLKAELRAKDPTFAQLSKKRQHTRAYDYMQLLYDRGQTIIKNGVHREHSIGCPMTETNLIIVSKVGLQTESLPHEGPDGSSAKSNQSKATKRNIDTTDVEMPGPKRLFQPSSEGADASSDTLRRIPTAQTQSSTSTDFPQAGHYSEASRQKEYHTLERTAQGNAILQTPRHELTRRYKGRSFWVRDLALLESRF